jgi:hypothetical protein
MLLSIARSSFGVLAGILALLAMLPGCGSSTAWKKGYEASYEASYSEAFKATHATGELAGASKGKAAAERARVTGRAYRPYSPFFVWSLLLGAGVGILLQYLVLLAGNIQGRASVFWLLALVPGSRSSLAYRHFDRLRKLELSHAQVIATIQTTKDQQLASLEAAKFAALQKIEAATTIEELSQIRLLDLARLEMSQVVNRAENRARDLVSTERRTAGVIACPHCGKRFGYKSRAASKTVSCPHRTCRQPVTLPPANQT